MKSKRFHDDAPKISRLTLTKLSIVQYDINGIINAVRDIEIIVTVIHNVYGVGFQGQKPLFNAAFFVIVNENWKKTTE